MSATNGQEVLATITNGKVPETRMADATAVQDFARNLRDKDDRRSKKRALVRGLVDGNPPYKATKLRDAGMANLCNVNFGTARSYMESGSGAFYDLAAEAPGHFAVVLDWGTPEEREGWQRTMASEADRVFNASPAWDFRIQNSQNEMTLHGRGPFVFENEWQVLPRSIRDGEFRVPEHAPADPDEWEACTIDVDYYPPKLWEFIGNEKAASTVGWNVKYTKKVIENAVDLMDGQQRVTDWEKIQQELKNNALSYCSETKVCKLVHVFWREFDGKITHAIVERETTTTDPGIPGSTKPTKAEFLYRKIGRYENFRQCVHPMYFDRGNGGEHHSVTGLGSKMYGAMEYENRLLCNGMDKAMAPKTMFKPVSAEAAVRFKLARHGDYMLLPAGYEAVQTPVAAINEDVLVMYRASSELMRSNLSSYRQQVPTRKEGNPATAFEKQMEASQQSALSKTTFNRYYKQLDALYAEIFRRLCKSGSQDPIAKDFQRRCKEKGVPEKCFSKVDRVEAVRVIGQGSAFMRKVAVDSLFPVVASLPEDGRDAWLRDKIAAEAGQTAVARYFPRPAQKLASDQQAEALQWVGSMKVGIPPVVTSSQNPAVYATTFLGAAFQALQSLQQGADPAEVYAFLQMAGRAIIAHLQRFAKDPTREGLYKQLLEQWKKLAAATDKLGAEMQQAQAQRKQQMAKTQKAMSEVEIKQFKAQNDAAIKRQKAQHDMMLTSARTRQELALGDAKTASEISRSNIESEHERMMDEERMKMEKASAKEE